MDRPNEDNKLTVGFVGQGYVGYHLANTIESKGYKVVRYALEFPYSQYKNDIKDCDMVFIAVPTPATKIGLNESAVYEALALVGKGATAIIKSTIMPGTADILHESSPEKHVLVCPEFLTARNAEFDVANPSRTILGIADCTKCREEIASRVLEVLPKAYYELVCTPGEAALIKLLNNLFPPMKVGYANLSYDLAVEGGYDPHVVLNALCADPRIGESFMQVAHEGGRGAGGPCIPKDLSALVMWSARLRFKYSLDSANSTTLEEPQNAWPVAVIGSIQGYNQHLLSQSGKK